MTNSTTHSLLSTARDAAWNGDHEQAISLCTAALAGNKLAAPERLDLYDTRAESYIAQGQLDLATADAAAMVASADKEMSPAFQAQALNCLALLQMRQGELEMAATTAKAALQAAEDSREDALKALSLFRFGEAQTRIGAVEPAVEATIQAAELYHRLGDPAGEGRSLWALSLAYFKLSKNDEVRRVLEKGLDLCRQAGDLYGTGNILNVQTFVEPDIAQNMKRLNQARLAFESAGYLERQITCSGNLSSGYQSLGLLKRANRLLVEATTIARRIGARLILAYNLGGLVEVAVQMGEAEAARRHLVEVEEMAPALGDPIVFQEIPAYRGRIALLENDLPKAIAAFKLAAKVADDNGTLTGEISSWIRLGEAYLRDGDAAAALASTTHGTDLHRAQGLGVLDGFSSQEVWWRHSQALAANQKQEQAKEALLTAYNFLLDPIASLSDEGLRRNYLNKNEVHRQIIAAWLAQGQEDGLAQEELYAHLAGEADLGEPFQRLVDSRFTAQRTEDGNGAA